MSDKLAPTYPKVKVDYRKQIVPCLQHGFFIFFRISNLISLSLQETFIPSDDLFPVDRTVFKFA